MEPKISIRQKIEELQKLRNYTQEKINKIQSECPHSKIEHKFVVSECLGRFVGSHESTCLLCKRMLGYDVAEQLTSDVPKDWIEERDV